MLSNVRKEKERGQFSSKTAIVCLPPGTHLTDCHENKLESLQFQIIAYHVLLHRQKQTLPPPSSPPRIYGNISKNFHPFMRENALQLGSTITIQKVCLFSAAFKMIYYLLRFFFKIIFFIPSGKEQFGSLCHYQSRAKAFNCGLLQFPPLTVDPAIRTVCYSDSKENHFQATRQMSRSWRKQERVHLKGTNATQQLILE